MAETLGCTVVTFGYETGWDFDIPSHRRELLRMLDDHMPDEIYLAPRCGLWSAMQSISAKTPEREAELQARRQEHHDVHLRFCRKIYLKQVYGARHCHLEQPLPALSWQTVALKDLPGHKAVFDQCRYGATCLDVDGYWKLVKKSTQVLTTKQTLAQALHLRCDGSHEHCHLEGRMMGGRLRTSYMEDYQPAMATVIATALASPEQPAGWESAHAVNHEKPVQGQLIQLYFENRAEAVRAVQRLHRNLGHPSTNSLCELLESRGASEVLKVARTYQCKACQMYRKPNAVAPASSKTVCEFNMVLQADVLWIKTGANKLPILSMVDVGTRYQAAVLIDSEKSEKFIKAISRNWIAHFGPPSKLITDEGRGWLHEKFESWTNEQSINHIVAPGQAHEQIALVERRHQVLRKAVEIYCQDHSIEGAKAVREALIYVVLLRSTAVLRSLVFHRCNGFLALNLAFLEIFCRPSCRQLTLEVQSTLRRS